MTEGNIVFYPLLEEGSLLHNQISVLMWRLLNCFKEFCSTFYIEFQSSLINVTVEAGNWNRSAVPVSFASNCGACRG